MLIFMNISEHSGALGRIFLINHEKYDSFSFK